MMLRLKAENSSNYTVTSPARTRRGYSLSSLSFAKRYARSYFGSTRSLILNASATENSPHEILLRNVLSGIPIAAAVERHDIPLARISLLRLLYTLIPPFLAQKIYAFAQIMVIVYPHSRRLSILFYALAYILAFAQKSNLFFVEKAIFYAFAHFYIDLIHFFSYTNLRKRVLKMGIGKTLIDVLNEKNENANSLANKVGVAPSTIYSIINRDNMKVDISLLAKICKALNVPMERFYIEYLQETAIAKNSTAPIESGGDDAGKQKLISNYDRMNETGQHCLVEYSDYLTSNPENLKSSADSHKMMA